MVRAHIILTAFGYHMKPEDSKLSKIDSHEVYHFAKQNDIRPSKAVVEFLKTKAALTLKFDSVPEIAGLLEDIFGLMNNPNREEELRSTTGYKGYSLSTGDMVVLGDDVWFCDSMGWAKIRPGAAQFILNEEVDGARNASMGLSWVIQQGGVDRFDVLEHTCPASLRG